MTPTNEASARPPKDRRAAIAALLLFLAAAVGGFALVNGWRASRTGPQATAPTAESAIREFLAGEQVPEKLGLEDLQVQPPAITGLTSSPGTRIAAAAAIGDQGLERILFAELRSNRSGWWVGDTWSVCLDPDPDPQLLVLVPFETQPPLVYLVGQDQTPDQVDLAGNRVRLAARDGPFFVVEGTVVRAEEAVHVYTMTGGGRYRLDERDSCGDAQTGAPGQAPRG